MALGLKYYGEFLSIGGTAWRVEILQEGFGGVQPTELTFPMDPLVIEWSETDKLKPVQCSNATLKIISESDREFIGLYSVAVGSVRMDVYRDGALYWSGTIDTELYEEPYSTKDGYDVSLTFSDLACLDRFDWSGSGIESINNIISTCLAMSGIRHGGIVKHISTKVSSYSDPISLEEVNVLQENFYDEDGEPNTAMEVLEAVLQPFALRIIQKAGKIHIYDLNAMHGETAAQVHWDSADAVLSVDKIYNNVKVTFSPYAEAEMMKGEVEQDSSLTPDSGGRLIKCDYAKNDYGNLTALDGFRLHYNEDMKSNMEISGGAKYFQICPIYSGKEENGVIASYKAGDYPVSIKGSVNTNVRQQLITPADCGTLANGNVSTMAIIKCPKTYLGYTSFRSMDYMLRINLDLLFDVRYNPFEEPSENNDNASYSSGFLGLGNSDGPYQNMQDWCNVGYIPIKLTLVDDDGNALQHYENYKTLESSGYSHSGNGWKSGAASWGQAYLCYYDFDDRKSKTGFGGWQTNKQIIGYYRDALPKQWKTLADGEYIKLPTQGGYLVLEIGRGVHQFDYQREVKDIYKFVRWVAYKNPSLTLCRKNYKEVEMEDIEDSAWLDKSAKEELTIDTILGTGGQSHGVPNAKGQLFTSSRSIYSEFHRAGVTDRLERLLIGTAYSQYATRHDILSGTTVLLPKFGVYSDAATDGKFILLGEVQNCRENISEIKMAAFDEDSYEGIEYE